MGKPTLLFMHINLTNHDPRITTSWDVRTKRVTYESVPTIDGVVGIANFGPHAVLFTVGRNHTVQQYDLNPEGTPMVVQHKQHVPSAVPPSPPFSDNDHVAPSSGTVTRKATPHHDALSSDGEGDSYKSPLQRIALDDEDRARMYAEDRDVLGALSPVSSHSSTRSSNKGRVQQRRIPQYPTRYDRSQSAKLRPTSPGMLSGSASAKTPSTVFSSGSSTTSSQRYTSRLRQEVLRSPEEVKPAARVDLFPWLKAQISEVQFRPPRYPDGSRSPDYLRQELLRCIFGWEGDVDELIRTELAHHPPGSASSVLLAKWLGSLEADLAASMVGSESMTSSDWMLLALSAVGGDSQKKVGDAFVQRLLEKGDIHPAVAILLGLGENNEAIEVYVSRGYFLEAVLLTCLLTPNDWQRISYLSRQWGEDAISKKETELAVRCFACTGVDSSEPWFSPAAKDAVYQAQMRILAPGNSPQGMSAPALSPTDSTGGRRPAHAGLKLITDFSNMNSSRVPKSAVGDDKTPMVGMTPLDTAISPGTAFRSRWTREPISSMTATPGDTTTRRFPSRDRSQDYYGRGPTSAVKARQDEYLYAQHSAKPASYLPSPAASAFSTSKMEARYRNGSRDRKPGDLHLDVTDVIIDASLPSAMTVSTDRTNNSSPALLRMHPPGSATTDSSSRQRVRAIDEYVSSISEATQRNTPTSRRTESQTRDARTTGRESRTTSRSRATSDSGKRYIRPSKRSPQSPVSMSPDDPALILAFANNRPIAPTEVRNEETSDVENFYRVASPSSAVPSGPDRVLSPANEHKGRDRTGHGRSASKRGRRSESTERVGRTGSSRSRPATGRAASRAKSPDREPGRRGRSRPVDGATGARSPQSPVSMIPNAFEEPTSAKPREQSIGARVRARGSSANRANREPSPDYHRPRERSSSRNPREERRAESPTRTSSRTMSRTRLAQMPKLQTNFSDQGGLMTRKNLAAQEQLEARRRSLARRPSAPVIMHPTQLGSPQDEASPMQMMIPTEQELIQGHAGNPQQLMQAAKAVTGTSTDSVRIGLPSNPGAMRHTKYVSSDEEDKAMQMDAQGLMANDETLVLPATTFRPPSRAASAPLEKMLAPNPSPRLVGRDSLGTRPIIHARMNSLNEIVTTPPPPPPAPLADPMQVLGSSVEVVHDPRHSVGNGPAILPELQHLANAQGPPVASEESFSTSSSSLGIINIGMATPEPMPFNPPAPSASVPALGPHVEVSSPAKSHRRARGSIGGSVNEAMISSQTGGFGGKLRGVRDRLRDRSASRNRNASPPRYARSPYESINEPVDRTSSAPPQHMIPAQSTTSLLNVAGPAPAGDHGGLATLPSVAYGAKPRGQTLSAAAYNPNASNPSLPSTTAGYRNPKDIARAAMAAEPTKTMSPPPPGSSVPSTTAGYRTPKEIARAVMQQSAGSAPPIPPMPHFGVNAERPAPAGLPSNMAGYRNPKDIRANMPPSSVQPGTEPMQTLNGEPF
jgi:hypothetical protein